MTWSEQMRCIVLVDMALMRLVAGAALLGTTEAFALSGGRGGSGGGSCSGLLSAPSAGEEAEAVAVAVRELHGDEEATAPSLGRREEAAAAAAKELMSMGAVIYAEPEVWPTTARSTFHVLACGRPEVAVTYNVLSVRYVETSTAEAPAVPALPQLCECLVDVRVTPLRFVRTNVHIFAAWYRRARYSPACGLPAAEGPLSRRNFNPSSWGICLFVGSSGGRRESNGSSTVHGLS